MEGLTLSGVAHDLTHIVLCLMAIVVLLGMLCLIIGKISEHSQSESVEVKDSEVQG